MRRQWNDLLFDLSYGLRQLRSNLSLAFVCVGVLAIGIGTATAVFTVLYDSVLKPPPYREAKKLVFVHNEFPATPLQQTYVSPPDFRDLSSHAELFSDTAAYYFNDFTMSGAGYAQHIDVVNASASLFPMLGIQPKLGRAFSSEEDKFRAPKVAVLSDAFWRSSFGADKNVIGRSVDLDGEPYQIVGVMPADFNFPYPATQMWVPLALPASDFAPDARGSKWLRMLGRISSGLSLARASAILALLGHGYAGAYPSDCPEKTGWHFSIQPLIEQRTSGVRNWLWLAFGVAGCVLLIACVNVSGLLLIRADIRQKEWAVRAALGASRTRLLRQTLVETGLLVCSGGGTGLLLAIFLLKASNWSNPNHHMTADQLGPLRNGEVAIWTFVFALAVCVLATFLASSLPAASVFRAPLDRALRVVAHTSTGSTGWRRILAAGQISIAVALLFIAISLSQSFVKLLHISPGFSADHVWTGIVQLPRPSFTNGSKSNVEFFQRLVRQISALPGVESASAVNDLPFSSGGTTVEFDFPGQPGMAVRPSARVNEVLPGYFETMRIPLLDGRTFAEGDVAKSLMIVNRAFAEKYFPGKNPIGKLVSYNGSNQIVGVVGDVSNRNLAEPPQPEMYIPIAYSAMFLVARTGNDASLTIGVRSALERMDNSVALFHVETMSERIGDTLRLRRFTAWLINSFALVGLLLATLGLYGTLAHLVQLRRREIAIRMALGASTNDIRALVTRHTVAIALAGLLPGILLSFVAARATRSFFFGVAPLDPWIVGCTIIGFILLALLASWNPARQASRVNALTTLREE